MRLVKGCTPVDSLDEFLQERDAVLDELHFQLLKSQHTMKVAADNRRRDVEFMENDLVYLKLQHYRQQSLARRPFEKLAARFYGPFRILQRIGWVAYKMALPDHSKLHPVFHVSQLKRAVGTVPVSPTLPAQLTADLELVVEPEQVLEVRQVQTGNGLRLEALIKWKDFLNHESTWEDVIIAAMQFPRFHLEDKVDVWVRGNVMNQNEGRPLLLYTRTRKKGNDKMVISAGKRDNGSTIESRDKTENT